MTTVNKTTNYTVSANSYTIEESKIPKNNSITI